MIVHGDSGLGKPPKWQLDFVEHFKVADRFWCILRFLGLSSKAKKGIPQQINFPDLFGSGVEARWCLEKKLVIQLTWCHCMNQAFRVKGSG